MFRKPREGGLKPSTGRKPSPTTPKTKSTLASSETQRSSMKPLTPLPMAKSNASTPSRQDTKKAYGKPGTKPNHSILNFFKKVDTPEDDASSSEMFVPEKRKSVQPVKPRSRSATPEELRFNESDEPVKRRRLSASAECSPPPPEVDQKASSVEEEAKKEVQKPKEKKRNRGPFLDDTDSEDDDTVNPVQAKKAFENADQIQALAVKAEHAEIEANINRQSVDMQNIVETEEVNQKDISENKPAVPGLSSARQASITNDLSIKPTLKKEETSTDEFGFEDMEDFQDDEFLEGEEFIERKWMEEQAMLEENEMNSRGASETLTLDNSTFSSNDIPSCPICDANLHGITNDQASIHVNACLDGNPIPLPKPIKPESTTETKMMSASRFSRASIAKPGQENPFELGDVGAAPSSAFSKLMSSKAEDTAWANAAAAEQASRGKPAYRRTCPFYKIMPGLSVCVDAFRYGAVQGCNAYFLSHFHSDHYIGLTSTWSHGPIYCSKVTANLVRQQLRVDPKYVMPLDFDTKLEIPNTQGVTVYMIPANHCPGSSLFFFEKPLARGPNPKVQRILHCGDFRACPAHISHPLLMPDIVNSITGKTKQQKIDVCYLDTTYLNPKYAFPAQNDVIQACADMCVSLKKERAEESDAWEVVKKERAGAGMAKFVSGKNTMKAEDDSIAMSLAHSSSSTNTENKQGRGRLLVICGTYSIGKERICMGIAKALDCKIWAPPGKQKICAALEDPELMTRMTNDPREAQIHMQMLMEIRAETLQDYLNGYKPHFSRIVGFRPSGWNYRPPNSRFIESPSIQTILHSDNWRSRYNMAELIPQRGSTREASCFGVPYSEHSSFRELTMFCCALRIEKIVPTVNVGSAASRAKMKAWIDRWLTERRKNGVVKIGDGVGEVKW